MKTVEKYGPDVEAAKELAIEEIGLPEEDLIIEVLQKPKKGIAGLLGFSESVPAKVRVTEKSGADKDLQSGPQEEPLPSQIDLRKKGKVDPAVIAEGGASSSRGSHDGRSRGDRPHGDRPRGDRHNDRRSSSRFGRDEGFRHEEIEDITANFEKYEGAEADFAKEFVAKMGFAVETESFIDEDIVYIKVSGEDARFLIGKEGHTLDALSYMLSLTALKKDFKRIRIDIEGYNQKRSLKAVRYALKRMEKVLATKKPETLSAMNRIERKAVHDALQKNGGVKTKSEGKEPHRRITIMIAD